MDAQAKLEIQNTNKTAWRAHAEHALTMPSHQHFVQPQDYALLRLLVTPNLVAYLVLAGQLPAVQES